MNTTLPQRFVGTEQRTLIASLAAAITVLGILVVNPPSLAHYVYYLCLWLLFIGLFHREEIEDFGFAFVVNSALIAVFFIVQTNVFPDSYGTTSPLGAWTDDSYFFALAADNIPPDLLVRENFFLYTHVFTNVVRALTFIPIEHPMDVIFFQSGVAAALATFSKRFMFQQSSDIRLSETVFTFALVCPFLMMNGGLIFIRDTFAAALLIYSLCCIGSKKFALALAALILQLMLRPGTALILLPVYAIIYFSEIKRTLLRYWPAAIVLSLLVIYGAEWIFGLLPEAITNPIVGAAFSFIGREIYEELAADPNVNVVFLAIQELPFLIKFILGGCYIFLYPFLSPKNAFPDIYFDIRSILMNLIIPIYAFWLNAWFIAGTITKVRVAKRQTRVLFAVLAALVFIGTYSLQTRHKTIIYPLYYFVIAIGFTSATYRDRTVGYWCSSVLILFQLIFIFR